MGRTNMDGHRWLLFLTTSSDDTKPCMILVALIKGFQNHMGFAIIRASGEELTGMGPSDRRTSSYAV